MAVASAAKAENLSIGAERALYSAPAPKLRTMVGATVASTTLPVVDLSATGFQRTRTHVTTLVAASTTVVAAFTTVVAAFTAAYTMTTSGAAPCFQYVVPGA